MPKLNFARFRWPLSWRGRRVRWALMIAYLVAIYLAGFIWYPRPGA